MGEVLVGRKHGQVMVYAQLGQKRIDSLDLHARSAAAIAQFSSLDVIVHLRMLAVGETIAAQ